MMTDNFHIDNFRKGYDMISNNDRILNCRDKKSDNDSNTNNQNNSSYNEYEVISYQLVAQTLFWRVGMDALSISITLNNVPFDEWGLPILTENRMDMSKSFINKLEQYKQGENSPKDGEHYPLQQTNKIKTRLGDTF